MIDFSGTDACSARKLGFNGGYNCSGSFDSFSCSLSCPEGVPFEFTPAPVYTCTYDVGIFQPLPIPQCVYGQNMIVIPTGHHESFNEIPDGSSVHTGGLFPTHETVGGHLER